MTNDVFGIVGSTVAGAYQVEHVVAEGGFGVVYRAYHPGFRAHVALKCLKVPQGLDAKNQETFLEQFRAEAELLFRLSSAIPTVVRPLNVDAMTTPSGHFVPYMALEWLDGENLETVMYRRKEDGRPPFTVKKLVRLLTPVARALERAHNFVSESGPISIVHRDLKPENIFIANLHGEDIVKILDFGIGKAKSVASQVAGRASQHDVGLASFTPAYGAPEQWLPKRFGQTGPWTDVWGLALTMVEVLAARPIIDGDHAAMMAMSVDPDRRPTPRNEGVKVSDEVEAVFARAMAVDPRDRHADAGLFWNELCSALGMDHALSVGGRRRDSRAEGFSAPIEDRVELEKPRSQSTPKGMEQAPASVRGAPPASSVSSGGFPALAQPVVPGTQSPPPSASNPSFPRLTLGIPQPAPASQRQPAPAAPAPASQRQPQQAAPPQSAPAPSAPAPSAPAPSAPAQPAPSGPEHAPPSMGGLRELDADGGGGGGMKLDLDLAPNEQPAATSRSGRWSAVTSQPPQRSTSSSSLPAVSQPSPRVEVGRVSGGSGLTVNQPAESPLMPRLKTPLILVGLGVALSIAQGVYASSTGEVLSLGPVRMSWVAGPIIVLGIGMGVYRALNKS